MPGEKIREVVQVLRVAPHVGGQKRDRGELPQPRLEHRVLLRFGPVRCRIILPLKPAVGIADVDEYPEARLGDGLEHRVQAGGVEQEVQPVADPGRKPQLDERRSVRLRPVNGFDGSVHERDLAAGFREHGPDGEGDLPGVLPAEGEAGVERSDRDERRDPVEPRGLDQLMIRRRLGHVGVDVDDRPLRLPRRGRREPRGPRFLERLSVHRRSFPRLGSQTIMPKTW